jgi:hypothetical protein
LQQALFSDLGEDKTKQPTQHNSSTKLIMNQNEEKMEPLAIANKPSSGFQYLFFGIALVVVPLVWGLFLINSTIIIAKNPVASWYVELWVLLGAAWLLFYKKSNHDSRLIVEVSTFIAALGIFITKAVIGVH